MPSQNTKYAGAAVLAAALLGGGFLAHHLRDGEKPVVLNNPGPPPAPPATYKDKLALAWSAGWKDYTEGVPRYGNPYSANDPSLAHAWTDGWDAARRRFKK